MSWENELYYGDNLTVLREQIKTDSVDLIYLDPPFNSKSNYNVIFKTKSGLGSEAQIQAFEDTWHWTQEAEEEFDLVIRSGNTDCADLLRAFRSFLGENDVMAYLTMMAARLLELHRVLKPTGSIYLHCDPSASHYLKILLDGIFKGFFQNEIIWKRTSAHNSAKRWGPVHDVILFYTKSNEFKWNTVFQRYSEEYVEAFYRHKDENGRRFRIGDLTGAGVRNGDSGGVWRGVNPTAKGRHWAPPRKFPGGENLPKSTNDALDALDELGRIYWPKAGGVPQFKRYLDDMKGVAAQDVIDDIDPLSAQGMERLGYPTQKPLSLMERIIEASSDEGDVVLDPFCGCGTTVHAAQKLRRSWIGIDITHLAISLIERRLKDAFPGITFAVQGTPRDLDGARDLAIRDKYQFQWWALSLIDSQPFAGKKKGADGGIDGLIYFKSDSKTTERAVVSVKGGDNVSVAMVRDLKGVLDREKAPIGVFMTLVPPTKPMLAEAASAGFYTLGERQYPRIQIITIEDGLNGKKPAIPLIDMGAAFKKTMKEKTGSQSAFDL